MTTTQAQVYLWMATCADVLWRNETERPIVAPSWAVATEMAVAASVNTGFHLVSLRSMAEQDVLIAPVQEPSQ